MFMKLVLSVIVIGGSCVSPAACALKSRVEEPFNLDWSFIRATKKTEKTVPDAKAKWREVNVPHDYSFDSEFVPARDKAKADLTVGQLGLHLGSRSTGYLPGGSAWYKKTFYVPKDYADKKVQILFDGVYMYSDVYINEQHLGHHHYGYTAFHYDLTPHLKIGEKNEIVVRTDNKLESRWYSGSGIYRDVKLIVTQKVHIPIWGTFVTTPEVSEKKAQAAIETKVRNDSDEAETVTLVSDILDASGKKVASVKSKQKVDAGAEVVIKQNVDVKNPVLWSVEDPNLYKVISMVKKGGKIVDDRETVFGVRTLRFDPDEGFFLNGVYTRLYGVCMHHDNGLLGAESYSWAEERKIIKLKEMGCNAIRCAHNPPSAAMLEACDRQGMLVMNEAFDEWKKGKAHGYDKVFDQYWKKDIESMLYRDRNHPSIIMWSTGNEVPDQGTPAGPGLSKMLADHIRSIDKTRPVIVCAQPGDWTWGNHFPVPEFFAPVDVCGYNYQNLSREKGGDFKKNHEQFPERIMCQSESMNNVFFDDWMNIISTKYVLGDFVWTGVDYLGEVGIGSCDSVGGNFPAYHAVCGDLDICCFRKPRSWYRQLLWRQKPTVFATVAKIGDFREINSWGAKPTISSWTFEHDAGKERSVDVYSGCQEAELFLNGKSLGKKATSQKTRFMATWHVPYEKGKLKAVGYVDGKAVDEYELTSAGKAAALRLTSDRKAIKADGCDVCYITAEIVDGNGVRSTLSEDEINFELSGPATVAAVGSSNPHAQVKYPFHGSKCKAYQGRALLIVRSGTDKGTVKVKAVVKGLKSGNVTVEVQKE